MANYNAGTAGFLPIASYATTDENTDRILAKAKAINDQFGVKELLDKRKAVILAAGTKLLIIDAPHFWGSARIVRVLTGDKQGDLFYIKDFRLERLEPDSARVARKGADDINEESNNWPIGDQPAIEGKIRPQPGESLAQACQRVLRATTGAELSLHDAQALVRAFQRRRELFSEERFTMRVFERPHVTFDNNFWLEHLILMHKACWYDLGCTTSPETNPTKETLENLGRMRKRLPKVLRAKGETPAMTCQRIYRAISADPLSDDEAAGMVASIQVQCRLGSLINACIGGVTIEDLVLARHASASFLPSGPDNKLNEVNEILKRLDKK